MEKNTEAVYIYGRYVREKQIDIDSLETPKGFYFWTSKGKPVGEEVADSYELLFSMEPLTNSLTVAEENGLEYLGANVFPYFYATDQKNGYYYTYVVGNLKKFTAPLDTIDKSDSETLLYPVSWSGARINLVKDWNTKKLYAASYAETVMMTVRWPNRYSYETLGPLTKDLALERGVGIPNPSEDPQNSEIAKMYFNRLRAIELEKPQDYTQENDPTMLRVG